MKRIHKFIDDSTTSLKIRNYRLYFTGQIISSTGTFMQILALQWLILQLTNSGIELGLVTALQFLPVLILAPLGGILVDRFSKRKVLFLTQSLLFLLAIGLGITVETGTVQVWMVYAFALAFGLITTVNLPAEQAFLLELVGKSELKNAVTIDNIQYNLARVIGPTIGGIVIFALGIPSCFILNGFSYLALIIAMLMMDVRQIKETRLIEISKGQLTAGVRYVLASKSLFYTLIILGIIGTITYEFTVSLPLLARFTFDGDAGTYALLTSAMGLGAIFGGILTAKEKSVEPKRFIVAAFSLGSAIILSALAPTLTLLAAGLVVVGFCSIHFLTNGRLMLQVETDSEMMGRVMAFWSMAFLGSTAIGAPLVGWVGQTIDPRWSLAVGGIAAIFAGCLGWITLGRSRIGKRKGIQTQ